MRGLRGAGAVFVAATLAGAIWGTVRAVQRNLRVQSAVLNETLPIHSKWWRDIAKRDGELLYVALGDSAAQGIGASTPERGYVGVLAAELGALTGRTVRVVNLSVSGATVSDAVSYQVPRLKKLTPDVVTVAIGANDVARFDPTAFERHLATVYDALPASAIVADLPYFYLPRNERKVAIANEIVRRLARERGLTVVPLHATLKRRGILGLVTHFARDMFHPNDLGYRSWASAFEPAVAAAARRP